MALRDLEGTLEFTERPKRLTPTNCERQSRFTSDGFGDLDLVDEIEGDSGLARFDQVNATSDHSLDKLTVQRPLSCEDFSNGRCADDQVIHRWIELHIQM